MLISRFFDMFFFFFFFLGGGFGGWGWRWDNDSQGGRVPRPATDNERGRHASVKQYL